VKRERPDSDAVVAAINELSRLAPFEGSALRFAARPLADGALVGPAGDRLGRKVMGWHEEVGQAFTRAFERLLALDPAVEDRFLRLVPPRLDRLPPPSPSPRAGVVGGDLEKLAALANGLRRASGELRQCADIMATAMNRAGAGTAEARSIDRIADEVAQEIADVQRRRDELAKRPAPVFTGDLRGKGPAAPDTTTADAEEPPAGEIGQAVDALIARGVLPPEFARMRPAEAMRYLERHPEVAVALGEAESGVLLPSALRAALVPVLHAPGSRTVDSPLDRVRAAFEKMPPAERRWTAILFPAVVGNLSGAPFSARIWANRVNIIRAAEKQKDKVIRLQAELARLRAMGDALPDAPAKLKEAEQRLHAAEVRLGTFQTLLKDDRRKPGFDRQILLFDPDQGKIAELHGEIGPKTRNVGVLVPGTGTNLDNFHSVRKTSQTFVTESNASDDGSLAMISWLGGNLPQDIFTEAPDPKYAQNLAPNLALFSRELAQEIRFAPTPARKVAVTVAGHSYGGAVVGLSETFGLDADRVLHIESAGAGYGVTAGNAQKLYKNPNPDVRRFSMTAPGDPIGMTQGVSAAGWGHGADPDKLPGVTRLETGNYPRELPDDPKKAGRPIQGIEAHSDVFIPQSDAWKNMYGVFTGGEIVHDSGPVAPRLTEPYPQKELLT